MSEFTINEMKEMQRMLQEKYKDKWEGISAEVGQNKLLWMIGEIGEVIDIVKKHSGLKASQDILYVNRFHMSIVTILIFAQNIWVIFGSFA